MNPGIYYMSGLTKKPLYIYSIRRVVSRYTGPGIRVRRNATAVTQDFYYDSVTGELDSAAIVSFVGAGNIGYVNLWYDQTGNGNHLGLPSSGYPVAGREPRIVISNSIVTKNGKIALSFGTSFSNLRSLSTLSIPINDLSLFIVCANNTTSTNQRAIVIGNTIFPRVSNDASDYFSYAGADRLILGNSDTSNKIYSSLATPIEISAWKNNVLVSAPSAQSSTNVGTQILVGINAGTGTQLFNGTIQEILIYRGDVPARYSITSEMMSYYSIT